MELLINLISGALCSNVIGGLAPRLGLGVMGNTIIGIIGAGLGGLMLSMTGNSGQVSGIIGPVVSGCAGGGIATVAIGLIKQAVGK